MTCAVGYRAMSEQQRLHISGMHAGTDVTCVASDTPTRDGASEGGPRSARDGGTPGGEGYRKAQEALHNLKREGWETVKIMVLSFRAEMVALLDDLPAVVRLTTSHVHSLILISEHKLCTCTSDLHRSCTTLPACSPHGCNMHNPPPHHGYPVGRGLQACMCREPHQHTSMHCADGAGVRERAVDNESWSAGKDHHEHV